MAHFNKTEGFFLMVQRGDCTFHTKIKNAEAFGAEMIIIADYDPEELDKIKDKEIESYESASDGLFMPEIPSFEISYDNAADIYETIKTG